MKKQSRKTIAGKLRFVSILFVVLLCLGIGLFSFSSYAMDKFDSYDSNLADLLNLVMTEVDGDDLDECIATGVKSPAFLHTQDLLDRVKENYTIEYIYIIRPLNTNARDNIMDVMAGVTSEERRIDEDYYSVTMGGLTADNYSASVAAKYLKALHADGITYFTNQTEFGWDYTANIPIRTSSGEPTALLAVDISLKDITVMIIKYVIALTLAILIISSLCMFMVSQWMKKSVVFPLEQLENTAKTFVTDSREAEDPSQLILTPLDIKTGDEMETLSNAMNDMFADIKRNMIDLVDLNIEKGRISAELNVATQIQADILPSIFPKFTNRADMSLYAFMHPAKEVGGDFYDFFLVDDTHLAMVMADVSGKGVPAALFMMIAKTLIKNQAMSGDSPSEVLKKVNEQLLERNTAMLFVTVWMAIVDLTTGRGVSVNAGHEHPAICHKGGKYELDVYRHGPPVAVMDGLSFRERTFDLAPGDTLFVYTDGVTEATDNSGGLFGTDRMTEALNRDPGAEPESQISAVRKAIDDFVGTAPQFDDITMLCFRYKGPAPQ